VRFSYDNACDLLDSDASFRRVSIGHGYVRVGNWEAAGHISNSHTLCELWLTEPSTNTMRLAAQCTAKGPIFEPWQYAQGTMQRALS